MADPSPAQTIGDNAEGPRVEPPTLPEQGKASPYREVLNSWESFGPAPVSLGAESAITSAATVTVSPAVT